MFSAEPGIESIMDHVVPEALEPLGLRRVFRHKAASHYLGGREVYALPLTPGFYGMLLLGMRGPTSDYLLSLYMSIAVWVDPVEDAVARITGAERPVAGPARWDSPAEEAVARIAHDAGHSDSIRASTPYTNIRGKNSCARAVFVQDQRSWDYSASEMKEETVERALPFWQSCATLDAYIALLASQPDWNFADKCDRLAIARSLSAGTPPA
ncbi:MAG TPA: hypothetical protein P5069_16865 [Candidatus Hydrogenedentes bacterium]|nr:hypothetical protein [Candidatus Hydrogenedentota bacterium]